MAHKSVDFATGEAFLMEFSCTKNQFHAGKYELELADHIVVLSDHLLVLQHKERNERDARDAVSEAKWFAKKILKQAKKQIKDTRRYLDQHTPITVANQLGQHVAVPTPAHGTKLFQAIVYKASKFLSQNERSMRFIPSETVGPIHLFEDADYIRVCETLVTPAEIFEYLDFRLHMWVQLSEKLQVSEMALLGQFLVDAPLAPPSEKFSVYVDALQQSDEGFGIIRERLKDFKKGMYNLSDSDLSASYPRILTVLAMLGRNDLVAFQERFLLMIERSQGDVMPASTMISVSPSRCGFVFLPGPRQSSNADERLRPLQLLVEAFRYRNHLDRCLGVVLSRQPPYIHAEWCLMDDPWAENEDLEELAKTVYSAGMLPAMSPKLRERYFFQIKGGGKS